MYACIVHIHIYNYMYTCTWAGWLPEWRQHRRLQEYHWIWVEGNQRGMHVSTYVCLCVCTRARNMRVVTYTFYPHVCTYLIIMTHAAHLHARTYKHEYTLTHIRTWIRTDTRTCMNTHWHTYMHEYSLTHIHAWIHTLQAARDAAVTTKAGRIVSRVAVALRFVRAFMGFTKVCLHVCNMHAYTQTYTYIHKVCVVCFLLEMWSRLAFMWLHGCIWLHYCIALQMLSAQVCMVAHAWVRAFWGISDASMDMQLYKVSMFIMPHA
jgi:hypothetical protein